MKYKLLIIIVLSLFASFTSCKKAPLTIGKIVTEKRALSNFNEVHLYDNISLTLVRSDTCYIIITTGKNIIENVTTNVDGNILTISNTSSLDWIRPYDYELHATLYYKDITNFIFASSGYLDTENQFNNDSVSTSYKLEIDGGSGDIELLVNNCHDFNTIYYYGTSRVNLHGKGNENLYIYKKSYGIVDARDFHTQHIAIQHNSVGDCYIWATESINAEIYNLGDIYYKGNPQDIVCKYGEYSKGKLIKLE